MAGADGRLGDGALICGREVEKLGMDLAEITLEGAGRAVLGPMPSALGAAAFAGVGE
jgi:hypothetical protein